MAIIQDTVLQCDECKHKWLNTREDLPKHCAKCRTRKWNQAGPTHVEAVTNTHTLSEDEVKPVSIAHTQARMAVDRVTTSQGRPVHDRKTCTTYGCLMCAVAKAKI